MPTGRLSAEALCLSANLLAVCHFRARSLRLHNAAMPQCRNTAIPHRQDKMHDWLTHPSKAMLREKRGAAVEPSIFRLVSEKILFPPPSLLERAKSTPTSRRLFPRGDELFLSVQTAQFRNYHPPYSNAIECKSAVQLAIKPGTRPATKDFLYRHAVE